MRCFSGSFFTNVGTAVNGGTFARCNFAGANFRPGPGSSVILSYQFNFSPATAGTLHHPGTGRARERHLQQWRSGPEHHHLGAVHASSRGGTLKPETLGPICDLRARHRHRGDPGRPGRAASGPFGRDRVRDRGSAPHRRLQRLRDRTTPRAADRARSSLRSPSKALVPDSLGPLIYRAQTGTVSAPYVLVEEIETTGGRVSWGPSRSGIMHLGAGFERSAASERLMWPRGPDPAPTACERLARLRARARPRSGSRWKWTHPGG